MSVKRGQLLVRLDDAEVTARLARAEAELEAAQYGREEAIQTQAEAQVRGAEARAAAAAAQGGVEAARRAVEEAQAAVAAAEAQASLARATLGRYRRLFEERALSQQEYDEAVARERTAKAEADRARARLEGARGALQQSQGRASQAEHAIEAAGLRVQALESRVRGAEARIRQAEAEASGSRSQLAYARIVAPGPGIVVRKSIEVGELAAPGTPLVTLDDASSYRLEAQLASSHAGKVRIRQPAVVWIDEVGGEPLSGRVAEVIAAADPATRTVTVKVDLPAAPGLRSGLYGRVRFALGATERLLVPVASLVERGQLTGVYVAEGGVARFRLVTLGERHGDRVEVLSGLDPGERIVEDRAERISDGSQLEAVP